jgi:hypothetical protein
MHCRREKLSAFVVAYNRAAIIGTCLRALSFADEIVVVDKSSTDETPAIAARHASRVITVPFSPTVEETRAFALAQCAHEWVLFLDDDECLSAEAADFIRGEMQAPAAEVYAFPRREYILGLHDERAYYWPEHHVRLFRRGAVTFRQTVHGGLCVESTAVMQVPVGSGACIHHLSHQDIAQWIEKANRYTSQADRVRVEHAGADLAAFAHARIDHWLARTRDPARDGYPAAVALLRAVYDLIDRLKTWEEEHGLDGAARFREVCAQLDAGVVGIGGEGLTTLPPPAGGAGEVCAPAFKSTALGRRIVRLRQAYDAAEARHRGEIAALDEELRALQAALSQVCAERGRWESRAQALAERWAAADEEGVAAEARAARAEAALRTIEASTSWRLTAGLRRTAAWVKATGARGVR